MACSSLVAGWFLKASTKNHCGLQLRAKRNTGTPRVSKSRCQRERSRDTCQVHSDDTVPMANAAGGWQGDRRVVQGSQRRISNSGNLASTAQRSCCSSRRKALSGWRTSWLTCLGYWIVPGHRWRMARDLRGRRRRAKILHRRQFRAKIPHRRRLRSEIPHRRLL